MIRCFWFCLFALFLTSCSPFGKESSADSSYTPGLENSTTAVTTSSLSALTVSAGTLAPLFNSNTYEYAVNVANTTTFITVTPTATDSSNSQITVNGTTVVSGVASSSLNLSVGSNTITIVVNSGTSSRITYHIVVTRAAAQLIISPSVDAHLTVNPSANQSVSTGSTLSFTLTASASYVVSTAVGGTCPAGSWAGNVYTTGTLTADCTVIFSSTPAGGMGAGWTPSWASMLAYWSLEETTYGTVNGGAADFADLGPAGINNGTHSGAITTGAAGKTGNAVSFANAGCITLPANAAFNTGVFTTMAWLKTSSSSIGNIISFYNAANSFEGWALLLNTALGMPAFGEEQRMDLKTLRLTI